MVLDGRDRRDLSRALDLLHADGRDPDVLDQAALAALGDRADALFERRLGVHAVEVVEGDDVGAQAAKALLDL